MPAAKGIEAENNMRNKKIRGAGRREEKLSAVAEGGREGGLAVEE